MKVLLILFFAITTSGFASENITLDANHNKPDHTAWTVLLKKYVDNEGNVDYNAFKNNEPELDSYLNNLAKNTPTKDWTKSEKLAYYINLYNAGTVKLILDNLPTKSIKDIKKPWDIEWIKVGAKTYSLGQIEHDILRKMNEPRIHFAINCASYSCPKLLNKAYTASNLEEELEKATVDFINDKKRNKLTDKKLELSNIFKWYKNDFTETKSLIEYIQPYTKVKINTKASVNYLDYDWSLNEIK